MDPLISLHNATRKYCIDRIAHLHQVYANLCESRGERDITRTGVWTYSNAARDIFPRYNVLAAVLRDVETLSPSEFSSRSDLQEMLALAASTAQSPFTKTSHSIEAAAIASERQAMRDILTQLNDSRCATVPQLPYRRVLRDAENKQWRQRFVATWGNWDGGCVDRQNIPANVTLHTDVMETAESYEFIRESLRSRGLSRIIEMREGDDSFELDLEAASFRYNFSEGFWTSDAMDWMITASHESSITFGGEWLIAAMRAGLPQFEKYIYKGWDSDLYKETS